MHISFRNIFFTYHESVAKFSWKMKILNPQRLAKSNFQFSANMKTFQNLDMMESINLAEFAMLMLKTRISRMRYARDHVHAIICSCDEELRDHEQRPPLILGSAARLSRISAVIRARETVLYNVVYPTWSESFWFYQFAECRSILYRIGVLCATTNRKFRFAFTLARVHRATKHDQW